MRAQPPGPTGLPLLGSSRQYARDPFTFLSGVADAYGDVVRFDLGPVETFLLTNPADVERVLVTDDATYRKPDFGDDAIDALLGDGLLLSDGEEWREQRRRLQPAFAPGRIGSMDGLITDHAEAMLDGWAAGDLRDVHLEMARVTVRVIVEAMFGATLTDEQTRTVQENLEPLGRRFEPDPLQFLVPGWAPTRENRAYRGSVAELEGVLDDVVAERRGTERDPGIDDAAGDGPPMDLLSILLRAGPDDGADPRLRDELMTMLLAGHDTTALTLTYAWYLLSEHPEVEARVHREVDGLPDDGALTAEDVRDLECLERVLQEAMRLYPPVYVMFREPQVDVRLGGYRIPAGSAVMVSQWVTHRSDRWYDDPDRFDPDRWRPERRADRPRFSYFPFGGGPRHCIGKHLSMLEAKLILATVAREYELDYARDRPLDLRGSLTMHPEEPVAMRVRSR